MKRGLFVLVILGLAGCASPEPAPTAEASAEIITYAFTPQTLEVTTGTRVTWTNGDEVRHTVTPIDRQKWGGDGSGDDEENWLEQGESWSYVFRSVGEFTYFCIPHANMTATVIVR
jgi:plastocyanin